jgi:hypothetical protein
MHDLLQSPTSLRECQNTQLENTLAELQSSSTAGVQKHTGANGVQKHTGNLMRHQMQHLRSTGK